MKKPSSNHRMLVLLASIVLSVTPELRSQESGSGPIQVGQDDSGLYVTFPEGLVITGTGGFPLDLNGDVLGIPGPEAPLQIEIPEGLTVTFPDVPAPPVQLNTEEGLVISTLKRNGKSSVKVHRSSLKLRLPSRETIKLPGAKMTTLASGQKVVQLTRATSFKLPKQSFLTLGPPAPGVTMDPLPRPALKSPRTPMPN
jgi:hypothetical protein